MKLSRLLYQVIDQNYQNKGIRHSLYDSIRKSHYGYSVFSYNGQGECGQTSRIVQEYLLSHCLKTTLCYVSLIEFAQKSGFSCCDHMFLRTDDNLIIDPSWKQLFFQRSGNKEKWFSAYAERLYNLDPVFIGTQYKLEKTISDLYKIRQQDFYHRDDVWFDGWHKEDQKSPKRDNRNYI